MNTGARTSEQVEDSEADRSAGQVSRAAAQQIQDDRHAEQQDSGGDDHFHSTYHPTLHPPKRMLTKRRDVTTRVT